SFFEAIYKVLARGTLTEADLDATPGFNANAFTIGSALAISTIMPQPQTLEDAFTVIHQSLLVMLSAINKEAGGSEIPRPTLLADAEARPRKITRPQMVSIDSPMTLIGVNVEPDTMDLDFNFQLQNHSLQISAIYGKQT